MEAPVISSEWRQRIRSWVGLAVPTPFEIILTLVVAGMVVWGAIPHFSAWSAQRLLEEEQNTVQELRSSLAELQSAGRRCPQSLDVSADSAQTSALFAGVLVDPPPAGRWERRDDVYVGPAGGWYRYDPLTCQFISMAARDSLPGAERSGR